MASSTLDSDSTPRLKHPLRLFPKAGNSHGSKVASRTHPQTSVPLSQTTSTHDGVSTSLPMRAQPSPANDVLADLESHLLDQRRADLVSHGEHLSLLFCGEAGCGKTSLLNSLFDQKISYLSPPVPTLSLVESKATIEIGELKLRLTTIDTPGYGDSMHIGESFERVTDHISQRFRSAIELERRPDRPGIDVLDESVGVDAVLYFIAPHRLKELDITFIRRLHSLATIVPIIAKTDVYTRDELRAFRESVTRRLRNEGIELPCEPFAVICGQYRHSEHDGTPSVRGRQYPWGTAFSECDEYSDLPALRKFLLTDGLMDLHSRRRAFYENFRSNLSIYRMELAESVISKMIRFGKLGANVAVRLSVVLIAASLMRNMSRGKVEAAGAERDEDNQEKSPWRTLLDIFKR